VELAALRIDWQEVDPEKMLGVALDRGKAQALIRLLRSSPACRWDRGGPRGLLCITCAGGSSLFPDRSEAPVNPTPHQAKQVDSADRADPP
jgi:hypothetical protein